MRHNNLIEDELFKPDVISEILLTVSGLVLFLPLLVFLAYLLTHAS
jgi:hypothetical protein